MVTHVFPPSKDSLKFSNLSSILIPESSFSQLGRTLESIYKMLIWNRVSAGLVDSVSFPRRGRVKSIETDEDPWSRVRRAGHPNNIRH